MKKTLKITSVLILVFVIISCQKDEEYSLMKNIFIEDEMNPGLPKYSEWGYNSFGVYIDRSPFVSESNIMPAKIFVKNDTLNLNFMGMYNSQSLYMRISIANEKPKTYNDLINFNKKHINLKDTICKVSLSYNHGKSWEALSIINGELIFNRAQMLRVDLEMQKAILSGTFRFQYLLNGEPTSATNGRFDFGIGYDNFYNLD